MPENELRPAMMLERVVPTLSPLPPDLAAAVNAEATVVERAAGSVMVEDGGRCGGMLLLEQGTLAVTATSGSGRSLVLHRARPGEPCGFVFRCLDAVAPYAAACTAETGVRGVLLPPELCERLLRDSPAFRDYVLASAGRKWNVALGSACAIAFEPLHARVAAALCTRAQREGVADLEWTHQQLADELGCTREAASRVLEHLASAGAVALSRGAVHLRDRALLERFAGPTP